MYGAWEDFVAFNSITSDCVDINILDTRVVWGHLICSIFTWMTSGYTVLVINLVLYIGHVNNRSMSALMYIHTWVILEVYSCCVREKQRWIWASYGGGKKEIVLNIQWSADQLKFVRSVNGIICALKTEN